MSTQTLEKKNPTDTGVCGTNSGWYRHRKRHEHPCDPCREAYNSERRKERGGVRPPLKPCGTTAAYKRHTTHGEKPCDVCKAAHKAMHAEIRRAKGIPERVDPQALIEEIEFLYHCGEGWARITQATGYKPSSLQTRLYEAGRADLYTAIFNTQPGWVGN